MKRCLRWLYDWATIITTYLVGLPTIMLQLLSFFNGVDLTPFVGPDTALKIVTGVAIVKGVLAFLESRLKEDE